MAQLSIDVLIPATVRVDTETGKVTMITASAEDVTVEEPQSIYNGDFLKEGNELPEFLPLDHPLSKEAVEIAKRYMVIGVARVNGRAEVEFDFEEDAP
jgi:hypothetical protein